MIKLAPSIFKGESEIEMGESGIENFLTYPLKLPYLSIFICLHGEALVNVNFKNYLLKKNSIMVVSEDSMTIFMKTSTDFKVYYCLINRILSSEIAYKLPNNLFSFLWNNPVCLPNRSEERLLSVWLEQFRHMAEECVMYRHLMFCNHLQNLFLKITERIPDENIIMQKYSRKELLCWKFWELIGKHCKEHRDVAFYARELCITPFYLSLISRMIMNDSPKDLIDRQVLLEMKVLLSDPNISIKEIAEKMNFDDTSYMCRYFKRHMNISLSEYRKSNNK